MQRSLRWRLVALFGLVIILSVVLSAVLSIWSTRNRFGVLVTEQDRAYAASIAPLLEASYQFWGNWQGLDSLFSESLLADTVPEQVFVDEGSSSVEWWTIVAQTLDIEGSILRKLVDEQETLAKVASTQDIPAENLVQALIDAEQKSLDYAVEQGFITSGQALDYASEIAEEAYRYVNEPYTPGQYDEKPWESTVHAHSESDENTGSVTWTEQGVEWLIGSVLLNDARLLVADTSGLVVYDSARNDMGKRLSNAYLDMGVALEDEYSAPIGTLIVAAKSDVYDAQQTAFLQSTNRALLLSGLLSGLVALGAGLLFSHRITAPVTALTQAAQKMQDGDWSVRVDVSTQDELGHMSAAFNTMADSLEAQYELRNRMVNDVAHELNTPLSVIQAELEALTDGYQTQDQAASHMTKEIQLLKNLVNDLAIIAEMDEERLQLNLVETDLLALVSAAIERWKPQADSANVKLYQQITVESLPPVLADEQRIAQIFGNLVANALQHTPQGGKIEIECTRDDARNQVSIAICDTGTGIPAVDLPHVFERFYRADSSRTRGTGGRGLGLAVVKGLIQAQGGHIRVESKQGEGTTFTFTLPYAPSKDTV